MDSEFGGLSSAEKQRRAAAEIARRKVFEAYEQKDINRAAEYIKKQDKAEQGVDGNRGERSSARVLGMSATPVLKTVSNEDWKKYHTAWQDYYQRYYSQYYMNAAKQYVIKERENTVASRSGASGEQKAENLSQNAAALHSAEKQGSDLKNSLKQRIQERAKEREKTSSRRKKLTPIFAGLAVVLTILFLQYNRLLFAPIAAYVSPGESPTEEITPVDPTVTLTKVSAENKLIIPKLNVDVPLHFGIGLDGVMTAMNSGVVHYRIKGASAYPGEVGDFVILGHSAGDIYSSNQYKFIFSGLERLEVGDIMYVHYNTTRYTYRMVESEIIWPTEVSKLVLDTDKPMMTLVTCWPLGTSRQRLLIRAEQISPAAENVTPQEEPAEETEEDAELPQNEDTLFDRIRKWFNGE